MEDNDNAQAKIIGLIDSSGSMSGNWKFLANHWNKYVPKDDTLTITFDTKPRIVPDNILDQNINKHGGGGTNIYTAFQKLEEELTKIQKDIPLVIIFISDGGHNSGGDIKTLLKKLKGNVDKRSINFICLGVGKGFPTFLSMELKELYHNGDLTLPAIFLIEFVSEKAYTIKFESIKKYFNFNKARKITPAVCLFPWREYTHDVFEKSWVLSNADKVKIDEDEMEINEFNLNLKGIQELFRSWSQKMQIDSLKEGEEIQKRAKQTLSVMEDILEELKSEKKVDLLKLTDLSSDETKLSFKQRAWNNYLRRNCDRIKWFYDDVKEMASGKTAEKLNSFEAAKKIGVGTIVGNYKTKVMNLKNITGPVFKKIKEEFKKILKTVKSSNIDINEPGIK